MLTFITAEIIHYAHTYAAAINVIRQIELSRMRHVYQPGMNTLAALEGDIFGQPHINLHISQGRVKTATSFFIVRLSDRQRWAQQGQIAFNSTTARHLF